MDANGYSGIALILQALTPVLLAVIGVFGAYITQKILKGQKEIHVLVNSQYTQAKKATLVSLKAQMVLLETAPNGIPVREALAKQIAELEEEILARDRTAASIAAEKQ